MGNIFSKSLDTLKRNYRLTIPTVITLGLFLVLINVFLFLSDVSERVVTNLAGKVSFTVYLKPEADFLNIRRLIESLENLNTVKAPVIYTSPETAQSEISHSLQLPVKNLAVFPGTLTITPKNPLDQKSIRLFLEQSRHQNLFLDPSEPVLADEEETFRQIGSELVKLRSLTQNMSWLLFFILTLAGLFIMFAMLRLETHPRKLELHIMKLVGASVASLEMPFLVEGMISGIIGWATGVIFTLTLPLLPFFPKDPFLLETFRALPFANIFLVEFLAVFFLGIIAGFLLLLRLNIRNHRI